VSRTDFSVVKACCSACIKANCRFLSEDQDLFLCGARIFAETMKIHLVLLVLSFVVCQIVNAASNSDLNSLSSFESESSSKEGSCTEVQFFSKRSERCLECSKCGSELYVKKECSEFHDTVCDGCFAESPAHNEDYFSKCKSFRDFYKKLSKAFENIRSEIGKNEQPTVNNSNSNWLLILYVVVSCVSLFAMLATVCMCCMRGKYTRVINVSPPRFSEIDDHNIIYAAEKAREKLANKRKSSVPYEYL